MAFLANQLDQVTALDDVAPDASIPVLPVPNAGLDDVDVHGRLESEERDWANLIPDAIRQIGEKLLAMDATEYFRLRAVCKPWSSSTDDNRATWEPCFFPRNWAMLREDEDDDDDDELADSAVPRRRRFVNVRTGATLWIQLPSFEEYGEFLADAEGLLIFYCRRTDTVRLFNPLTTATVVLPGFSGAPGLEGEVELMAAGIVINRRNAPELEGNLIIVPNVIVVMVPRLSLLGHGTLILSAKPDEDHWETVDAGVVEVDGGDVLPFEGGLSLQGHFYIPTRHGDVLRVELYPHHHLVYVARPPGRAHYCCCPQDVTSYLVPSLDGASGTGENDGMLLVRVFADYETDVLRVHLGNGSYTPIPAQSNRTIFLPRLTLVTDRFPSLVEQGEEGSVYLNERIEDYIGENV